MYQRRDQGREVCVVERITSRQNPWIIHVRKLLAQRDYRRQCGQYVADGVKLLDDTLHAGAQIDAVLCTPEIELPPLPETVRTVQVPSDVMASVSPMRAPQGLLLVCALPAVAPPERLDGRRYLILDGLQDPGNVGAIWRTADALGADGLLLIGNCADPWNPKTVRAAMGACFRLPVWEMGEDALIDLVRRSGLALYATALRDDTLDVRGADLARCAVVIGSEGGGVSRRMLEASGSALKIPMRSRCESLNAAAAAAVILWEMARGEDG